MHASTRSRSELNPVTFEPPRARGVTSGALVATWALAVAVLLVVIAAGAPATGKTLVAWAVAIILFLVAALAAHWTWSLATLRYTIEATHLEVRWGFSSLVLPLTDIQRMAPGRTASHTGVRGLTWWGCHIGHAEVERIGHTLFFATDAGPEDILYVVTPHANYALTIGDHVRFVEEVQARAYPGLAVARPQRVELRGYAALPAWSDGRFLTLAALAALACLVLTGYTFSEYPDLPNVVRLDFPGTQTLVRIGDKGQLLRIPFLGVGILAVNLAAGFVVHARERTAALWFAGSAALLQLVLLAAAIVTYTQA